MRPKKYVRSRLLTICVDDKDVSYLDDHRGKVTRGDYLRESMYALKGEHSEELKTSTEKIKQLSAENHELKKQLLFEQSKNKKSAPVIEINEVELIKFYEEKKIAEAIRNPPRGGVQWSTLHDRNLERLSIIGIGDKKVLESKCMSIFRNNGHAEGSTAQGVIS